MCRIYVMDRDNLGDGGLLNDLDGGRVTNKEGTGQDLCMGDRQTRNFENGPTNNLLGTNFLVGSEVGTNSYIEVIVKGENDEESKTLVEKKNVGKKYKKANYKKASKPPRPPRGPSLDAADMLLVREISAHAMNRRARIEQIKASRKMREEKSSFSLSKSSICAMIFTVLFIFVICFQGFCSKGVNSVNFHGSPEPATNSIISVQFFNQPSANEGGELGSSSSPEEQTIGSNFKESVGSTAVD